MLSTDMEASNLEEIADLVCDNMVNAGHLPFATREKVREALLLRHRHQHEREAKKKDNMSRLPIIRNLAEIGRNHSSSKSMLNHFTCISFVIHTHIRLPCPTEVHSQFSFMINEFHTFSSISF